MDWFDIVSRIQSQEHMSFSLNLRMEKYLQMDWEKGLVIWVMAIVFPEMYFCQHDVKRKRTGEKEQFCNVFFLYVLNKKQSTKKHFVQRRTSLLASNLYGLVFGIFQLFQVKK